MKGKSVILLSLGVIIASFLLFKLFSNQKKEDAKSNRPTTIKAVKVEQIKYLDYQTKIKSFGKLKAFNKIEIYSEVSGIVISTTPAFKEGNNIHKGSTIIKLDDHDTRLSLYAQRTDLQNIIIRILPDIKLEFPSSYNQWKEYADLFDIENNIRQLPETIDSKEKNFLAINNVFKLYYTIKRLELQISKYEIKAQFDGIISQALVENGTLVRINQKVGEFTGYNQFELELPVKKEDMLFITIGNKVNIYSNSKIWYGEISRINPVIDQSTQTFKVFATLQANDLYDGMYLEAEIEGNLIKNVYALPRKALVGKDQLYLIKNDSILAEQKVKIVRLDEDFAYIQGVDSMESAVIEPLVNIIPNTKVKPIK